MGQVLAEVQKRKSTKAKKPVVIVLTKADTLGRLREWPPEQYSAKAEVIKSYVHHIAEHLSEGQGHEPLTADTPPFRGCSIRGDSHFLYVLPANVPDDQEERWNMDTLVKFIGRELPYGARLQFYQALRQKELMQEASSALIMRFAGLAGLVGAAPIPIADIIVLVPLQMLMIALIGGLSCQELSMKTATSYLTASGATIAGGFGARELFRALSKLIVGPGDVLAGIIAGAATYGLGKSAEALFFAGEIRKPYEFKDEYKALPAPSNGAEAIDVSVAPDSSSEGKGESQRPSTNMAETIRQAIVATGTSVFDWLGGWRKRK